MAGHSKWANIKFRKAAQDAKRGKLFTKLIREITVAARAGGGDSASNPRLRTAIDKALSANMTRDTVDRAIKRGTGELEGVSYEEIRYEGYAPGGVAILVDCMTDNRNRTVGSTASLQQARRNLGTEGSVAYLFSKTGLFVFAPGTDEEAVMEAAVGAGADDVETIADGSIEVLAQPETFDAVNDALKGVGLEPELAQVLERPSNEAPVSNEDAEKVLRLVDALEELDDVQEVSERGFPENRLSVPGLFNAFEGLRTIGIDPGSRVTGIGVVEARGQSLHYIHSECVRTGTGSLGSRLVQIHQRIRAVISRFQPLSGAIEKVFVSANPQSALVLGQARGVRYWRWRKVTLRSVNTVRSKSSGQSRHGPRGQGTGAAHGESPAGHGSKAASGCGRRTRLCYLPSSSC